MVAAYPELVGEMAKRGITRTSVAQKLRISPRTFYSKLAGITDFTLSEANIIHTSFFPDVDKEALFARADQNSA